MFLQRQIYLYRLFDFGHSQTSIVFGKSPENSALSQKYKDML